LAAICHRRGALERIGAVGHNPAAVHAVLATAAAKANDGGMVRALAALAAALSLLLPALAWATSITAAPPHDTRLGCAAIKGVVANLAAGRLKDPDHLLGPTFFSDAAGRVEAAEEEAFLHSLNNNEGRPDAKPIRLYHVYRLHIDKHQPTYLVVLERHAWHETRLETDEMLMDHEVRDPHYGVDTSYWLATFRSNDIWYFREAGELYDVMSDARELEGCAQ
jgi:hypothetical protein